MISGNLLKAALLGLFMALIFGSCKKDVETSVSQTGNDSTKIDNGFARYAWTGKEADFFDLGTYKRIQSPGLVANRNNEPASLVYHPDLVGLYNEIAEQNETHHFVEDIVTNAGLPVWRYAQVIKPENAQNTLLIVPLAFDSFPAVTSFITAIKSQGQYTINAVSRKELLDTEHGNPQRKLSYAKALAFYDKLLFGNKGDASSAFCEYVSKIEENPTLPPVPPLPPGGDCEWRIVEVCSDDDAQATWFNWLGGISVLPPHLDHDGDGIINAQDQDWGELVIRFGVDQEDFTEYVLEWWQDEYEPEYGDYETFWDNYYNDDGGQDFHEFWDNVSNIWDELSNMWQDFWDWASSTDPFDDLYYEPQNPYEDCPWNPFHGGAIEEREIRCDWYFILDCGAAFEANNWAQVLTNEPCPQCPGFENYDDLFFGRIKEYYDTHEQAFLPFTSLDGLVQTAELIGCDAFSPGFEQCLNEALLASAFGLSYTNSFTEQAINWLVNTPVYPEGPGRVYTIATYWNSQGNSAEARERIERVVNWIGSVEGLNVDTNQLMWLLNNDEVTLHLIEGYTEGHFSDGDCLEIIQKMIFVHSPLGWEADIPRAEYIDQIDAIRIYLKRRHSEYGEAAQYIEAMLPYLINVDEFTNEEVYAVYEIVYSWYLDCAYNTLSQTVRFVVKAVKPFIELALIDASFRILTEIISVTANASYRLIELLPQSVKNASAYVWSRIISNAPLRPNTLIPETFVLTTESGTEYYVQYSGTKHFAELVTQHEATTYAWFESQKGLRSQIVLDDFVKAVDEIVTGNQAIIPGQPYYAGKWEIIFGEPTSISNGLPRIFHAVPSH